MVEKSILKKIVAKLSEEDIRRIREFLADEAKLLDAFDNVVRECEFEKNPHSREEIEAFLLEETKRSINTETETHRALFEKFLKRKGWKPVDLYLSMGMDKGQWHKYNTYHGLRSKDVKKTYDTHEQHRILLQMVVLLELDIDEATFFMGSIGHGFGSNGTDIIIKKCVERKKYDTWFIDECLELNGLDCLFSEE